MPAFRLLFALVLALVAPGLEAQPVRLTETHRVGPDDPARGDQFGGALALDGDRLVVGAIQERGPEDASPTAGAAYVFERSGGVWAEAAALRPPDPVGFETFGAALALDGDRLVVGAPSAVPGFETTPGAAYVYDLVDGDWTLTETLAAPDGEVGDWFGDAVALDGDRIAVAAPFDDEPGTGPPVFVFEATGGAWALAATLRPPAPSSPGDRFGTALSFLGDRLVVGSPFADGPDGATTDAGAVYVYARTGGAWGLEDVLWGAVEGDQFGESVALSAGRLVVGVPGDDGLREDAGAAAIVERAGGAWERTATLRPETARAGGLAGLEVAASADAVVIGAPNEGFETVGGLEIPAFYGAAFVFRERGGTWVEEAELVSADRDRNDRFGGALAVEGETVLVGASLEDAPDDALTNAGAVFAFDLPASTASTRGLEAPVAVAGPWPNPTAGRAALRLEAPTPRRVRVAVLDLLGREVAVAFEGWVAGEARVAVDASGLAPGVYAVRVEGGGGEASRLLTVAR